MRAGNSLEEVPTDDFTGKLHDAKGAKETGPAERFEFALQKLAKEERVSIQQDSYPIFTILFALDVICLRLPGRSFGPVVTEFETRQAAGDLPALTR